MDAVAPRSDQVAVVLENLSLDSQINTTEIPEPAYQGVHGNNETVMYHQGYGYTPFGTYPSLNSAVPTIGNNGQLYGTEQYQYPSPFYQAPALNDTLYSPNAVSASQNEVPTSAAADEVALSVGTASGNSNNKALWGSVNRSKPFAPSYQNSNSNLNGPYKREGLPTGFISPGYDPRFGYDGFQSPVPWLDPSMFSNRHAGHAMNNDFSSSMNLRPSRPASSFGQASGAMNMMYPNNRMYGQYGYRAGAGYGSYGGNSWTNGRGWLVVDNKYKPKGHGYGNENVDGLSELTRGPRVKGFKNQTEFGPVANEVQSQNPPPTENNNEDNMPPMLDMEQYNREDFPEDYSDANFFVIKSYSEDDVHKSIKYGVWASTPNGNKKLDAAYNEAKENSNGCPVFLLFSVNTSGQFVGVAEMVGSVDFNKTVEYWQQEKWIGCFPVKWHIIKDVPNSSLRYITLENNENKPVTNSRDTQEVAFGKGIEILKIFKGHKSKTSILDDFGFYAARERIMQERRAKLKIQKQVVDGKPSDDLANTKDNLTAMGKESSQKSMYSVSRAAELGKQLEENGSQTAVEYSSNNVNSVGSSEKQCCS